MRSLIFILLLLLLLLLPFVSAAQLSLSGKVTERNGSPLPGVNVWLKDSYDGAGTDAQGRFQFSADTSGIDTLVLVATALGYQRLELPLSGNGAELLLTLRPAVNELNAVTITSGSIEVSDRSRALVMTPLDIVTTAGALADITGALATLPGTATVGNDGRLFVRGGDATEVGIFFDGMRVGNAYGSTLSNLPTRNRFNPALFKGTFFSTGGYSAEYGDALSAVLALETVDMPVRSQTDIGISPLFLDVSSTLKGERGAITVDAGYLNLSPYQEVVRQDFDWEKAPRGANIQFSARHKVGDEGMLKVFVHGSSNRLGIWSPQPGEEGRGQLIKLDNDYSHANATYSDKLGDNWTSHTGASYSYNADHVDIAGAGSFRMLDEVVHLKQKFTWYAGQSFKLRTGAETFLQRYSSEDLGQELELKSDAALGAAFAEAEWYATPRFTLRGGLRTSYYSPSNDLRIEPRAAVAFEAYAGGTISAAFGQFSQVPQMAAQAFAGVNPALPEAFGPASASHYQLSFQHSEGGRTFRAELYEKQYRNLLRQPSLMAWTDGGEGHARGLDLFYRDRVSVKNLDYWVTYGYVHSRRSIREFAEAVQPSFAPTHNLSIVTRYWIEDWRSMPGATFTANSGMTYHNPNLAGAMNSTSPAFATLAINWSYLYKDNLILHVAVNNVLGRDNIFGYQYADSPDAQGQYAGLPLGQPAPRFFFIGVFWTLSKDKGANQLNNL